MALSLGLEKFSGLSRKGHWGLFLESPDASLGPKSYLLNCNPFVLKN